MFYLEIHLRSNNQMYCTVIGQYVSSLVRLQCKTKRQCKFYFEINNKVYFLIHTNIVQWVVTITSQCK